MVSKSVVLPLKVRVLLLVPLRENRLLGFSRMLKVAVSSLATKVWGFLVPSLAVIVASEVMPRFNAIFKALLPM